MDNVGILLFNDIELLDFAGPYEVFSVTSELNNYQLFNVFTVSQDSNVIKTVNGLRVMPDFTFSTHPIIDILIIPGGVGTKAAMKNPQFLEWIKNIYKGTKITMSVCSGARILGTLGLLDHQEATTHHEVIADLEQISPTTIISHNKRFIDNGQIMTSGGISAGIDLTLHIVSKIHGKDITAKTVRYMEYGDWQSQ